MDVNRETLAVLDEVLSLGGRALAFRRDTALLGAIPELDSMAVVSLITTLEERSGHQHRRRRHRRQHLRDGRLAGRLRVGQTGGVMRRRRT